MKLTFRLQLFVFSLFLANCQNDELVSQFKIGNGKEVEIEDDVTSSVVMLTRYVQSDMMFPGFDPYQGYCTGTFVNDTTLLTATHCVSAKSSGPGLKSVSVALPDGNYINSVNAFVMPEIESLVDKLTPLYSEGRNIDLEVFAENPECKLEENDPRAKRIAEINAKIDEIYESYPLFDAAVVVFPAGTGDAFTGGKYAPVRNTAPLSERTVRLVGFGNNTSEIVRAENTCSYTIESEGFGTKRQGFNTLKPHLNGLGRIEGIKDNTVASKQNIDLGRDVSVHRGDSGGPWFLCNNSDCDKPELIAVNSTGSAINDDRRWALATGLWTNSVQNLFERAINCSEQPCAQNFDGSGVEDNEISWSSDIYMTMVAEADGKEQIYVAVSRDIESVQLCTGNALECSDRVLSSQQFEKIGVRNSRPLFRSTVAQELQESRYVIQGLTKGDQPGSRRAFRLDKAE